MYNVCSSNISTKFKHHKHAQSPCLSTVCLETLTYGFLTLEHVHELNMIYYYYYYYYMIYIAPISRIESEALASLGGEHD